MPATTSSPCALTRNSPKKRVLAGAGIAREGDARGAASPMLPNTIACTLTAVPQCVGDVVELAVDDRALVVPRAEHRADRAPELLLRIGRERAACNASSPAALNSATSSLRCSVVSSVSSLTPSSCFFFSMTSSKGSASFGRLGLEPHHDVAVHLHEAAVAVPGEALVAGRLARGPRRSRR